MHHLKFVMRSLSSDVVREVVRTITNLSYDYTCTSLIVSAGVLVYNVNAIVSRDYGSYLLSIRGSHNWKHSKRDYTSKCTFRRRSIKTTYCSIKICRYGVSE